MSEPNGPRFTIQPEDAKAIMVASGAAIRAISGIDAVIEDGDAAREDAASRPGFPSLPEPPAELLEARAVREATLDQARALKRDLAELLADAETSWLEATGPATPFVSVQPKLSTPAPRLLRGIEVQPLEVARYLVEWERWFGREITFHLRAATAAMRELMPLLETDDPPSAALHRALETFISRVHGPR